MNTNESSIDKELIPAAVAAYSSRKVNRYRLDAIKQYAGKSIVDVGCGSGAYVLKLAKEYDIRGLDYKHFDSWNENPSLFAISDATKLDMDESSVDTIVSFETLEHLSDPLSTLKEFHRVVRKNVILTVPNCELTPALKRSGLIYSHWSDPTHVNFFNMDSIAALVEEAGFTVQHKYYINPISIGAAVFEVLGFSGKLGKYGEKYFNKLQRKPYFITTLVVAEKK